MQTSDMDKDVLFTLSKYYRERILSEAEVQYDAAWPHRANDEDLGFSASIIEDSPFEPFLHRYTVPGPLAHGLHEGQGSSGTGRRRGNSRYRQGLFEVTAVFGLKDPQLKT